MNFIIMFEGTGCTYRMSEQSCISKLHGYLSQDSEQCVLWESGSGTRGGCFKRCFNASTGADSLSIVFNQYVRLVHEIRSRKVEASDIKVFVFGFSRGAFQSVVFANMLNTIGLVDEVKGPRRLFLLYLWKSMQFWKKRNGIHVEYLGLIDTVKSVLHPIYCFLPSRVPKGVKCRHAVAINEYRFMFKPLQLSGKGLCVVEKLFLGAHSDVGWAYNGLTRKEQARDPSFNPQSIANRTDAKTKFLGRLALSWILDPVRDKIYGQLDTINLGTKEDACLCDYLSLLLRFCYTLHDSSYEDANFKSGIKKIRAAICKIEKHHSASMIEELLNNGVLDGIDTNVEMALKNSFKKDSKGLGVLDVKLDVFNDIQKAIARNFQKAVYVYKQNKKDVNMTAELCEICKHEQDLYKLIMQMNPGI